MTSAAGDEPVRRVVVAGGSGFIGRHVVQALVDAGTEVVVLSRTEPADGARPGVTHQTVDLAVDTPRLPPCDAVVNLVGIKAERGANTFTAAHVDAVRHLIAAMREVKVRRLVHVSVVSLPAELGAYAQTKRAGESVARQADVDCTILRPGLVVGPGDDAMTNLIRFIRLAPVFPVAAGPSGPLAVTDVRDVAEAVVASLARPQTIGEAIDVVGPQHWPLRDLIAKVAAALALPTFTVPIPGALQTAAAAIFERLPGTPIVTRSQLAMLRHGLAGAPRDAPDKLGIAPRPLTDARIVALADAVTDVAPSLRLTPSAAHRRWLDDRRGPGGRLAALLGAALLAMLVLPRWLPNIWIRMAAIEVGFATALIVATPSLRWRATLGASAKAVGVGLIAAAGLYAAGAVGFWTLAQLSPSTAGQAAVIYAWPDALALAPQLVLLALIVAGEDVVWRAGVTLPIAARFGAWTGVAASAVVFAAAHLTTGPPLLWGAALVCGALWAALLIRTRSLTATIVAHLAWDIAVIYIAPY